MFVKVTTNDQHCDGLGVNLELINKASDLYTMLSSWRGTNFESALIRRPKDGLHAREPKPAKLNA
ncbi:hypothetical protein [Emticicia aquatilis]|uniref:hypothetical protein n=1 Tax=Emticicia aquatilis TaxID=1537369 RepID=UPI00166E01CB|nr:hypothetical protein [Emticicia aquatilis]